MAEDIFVNVSYTLSQAGKYREAWEAAARGLTWSNSSSLVQNYMYAFSKGVDQLIQAGKRAEAKEWLMEVEKAFPTHRVVQQVKKQLS
jgi:hypothetical protein